MALKKSLDNLLHYFYISASWGTNCMADMRCYFFDDIFDSYLSIYHTNRCVSSTHVRTQTDRNQHELSAHYLPFRAR